MDKRPTQKDIARIAGVHVTAVSAALKGKANISEKMRKRIQEIADELGYFPDPMLQAITSYRTNSKNVPSKSTIACILPPFKQDKKTWLNFEKRYTKHITHYAQKMGYSIDFFELNDPLLNQETLNRNITHRGIVGILIIADTTSPFQLNLDWDNFPTVCIENSLSNLKFHRLQQDPFHAIQKLIQIAHKKGHTRAGIAISQNALDNHNRIQLASYNWGISERNMKPIKPFIYEHDILCYEKLKTWISSNQLEVVLGSENPIYKNYIKHFQKDFPCKFAALSKQSKGGRISGMYLKPEILVEKAVQLLNQQIIHNLKGVPKEAFVTLARRTYYQGETL